MALNIPSPSPLSKLTDMLSPSRTTKQATPHALLARLAAWRRTRQAEAALSSLSDRDLADIGLTRQTIHTAVRSARSFR